MNLLFKIFILGFVLYLSACSDDTIEQSIESHLPEQFAALTNVFNDGVGAAVWLGDDVTMLFDLDGTEYVWIENGQIMDRRQVKDSASIVKDITFSGITAAVTLRSRVYYSGNGRHYSNMSFNRDSVQGGWADTNFFALNSSVFLLDQWGEDSSCPFTSIRSMLSYHPDRYCDEGTEIGERLYMFNFHDFTNSLYDGLNVQFYAPTPNESYSLYSCETTLKTGLGLNTLIDAACIYEVQGVAYELFFFNGGESFVYSQIGSDVVSETLNLSNL